MGLAPCLSRSRWWRRDLSAARTGVTSGVRRCRHRATIVGVASPAASLFADRRANYVTASLSGPGNSETCVLRRKSWMRPMPHAIRIVIGAVLIFSIAFGAYETAWRLNESIRASETAARCRVSHSLTLDDGRICGDRLRPDIYDRAHDRRQRQDLSVGAAR